jgi:uncharacterized protein
VALSWLQDALAVLSGGAVGFSLGLIGGGGSILAVPLLLYVVGIGDAHVAIGTSALAVAANAFANLLSHWRAGNVKWSCAATFAVAGVLGAAIGSTLGKLVDGQQLLFLFALAMIAVGAAMLRPRAASSARSVACCGRVRARWSILNGRSRGRSCRSNGLKLWLGQSVLFRHPTNANSIAWQHSLTS